MTPPSAPKGKEVAANTFERNLIFFLGLALLIAVPLIKTATPLPAFMGILSALAYGGWWAKLFTGTRRLTKSGNCCRRTR